MKDPVAHSLIQRLKLLLKFDWSTQAAFQSNIYKINT